MSEKASKEQSRRKSKPPKSSLSKKKILTWVFISGLLLILGLGKFYKKNESSEKLGVEYQIQSPSNTEGQDLDQKPFVVIIPSYNNRKFCEKNLLSVFNQKYSNFRVIYIDDCSIDGTGERVEELIVQNHQEFRFQLIKNPKRCYAAENIYRAIHSCEDHEIIAILDGDDWFAHDFVLKELNRYYASSGVWATYGKAIAPEETDEVYGSLIPLSVIQKKAFRDVKPFYFSALRTFYAKLYKSIHLEDFLFEGKFLKMAGDMAFSFPIQEMAQGHTYLADQVLYVINRENPINDCKVDAGLQLKLDHWIRSRTKYGTLAELDLSPPKDETISLLVFSKNNPLYLFSTLESALNHLNLDIEVLYSADEGKMSQGYEQLALSFPTVKFIPIERALERVSLDEESYVLVADDKTIFTKDLELKSALSEMRQLGLKGVFFDKDPYVFNGDALNLTQNVFAFQIYNFNLAKPLTATFPVALFKKSELPLLNFIQEAPFFFEVYKEWIETDSNQRVIGVLGFTSAYKLEDPFTFTSKEALLTHFLNGEKMNLTPNSETIHFIKR